MKGWRTVTRTTNSYPLGFLTTLLLTLLLIDTTNFHFITVTTRLFLLASFTSPGESSRYLVCFPNCILDCIHFYKLLLFFYDLFALFNIVINNYLHNASEHEITIADSFTGLTYLPFIILLDIVGARSWLSFKTIRFEIYSLFRAPSNTNITPWTF